MKVLIIGGSRFLGRTLTEQLLKRNHDVTLFNRGQSNPSFQANIPAIIGDRETQIENLGNQTWDVVIDTCGYLPRIVELSAEYLKDKTHKYVFISSVSVYDESKKVDQDENAPVIELEDKTTEDIMGEPNNYGGLKVLCERVVQDMYHNNSLIIRPGLIVGPHDPTNRFTYWPVRIRKGGAILLPNNKSQHVQVIDVRDLAGFIVGLVEENINGVFNVTGPHQPFSFESVIDSCIKVVGNTPSLIYAQEDWLLNNDVKPWMELPLWLPEGSSVMDTNISKAIEAGLSFTPLKKTIEDTLNWYDDINGDSKEWSAGLSADKELSLINTLTTKSSGN